MRETRVENRSDWTVYLRERQFPAVAGCYGYSITVGPHDRDDVVSTVFTDRNRDSGRPSEIVIFLNENRLLKSLTPETFSRFVKLIFELDTKNGYLLVYGIPPRITDLAHFWRKLK